MGKKKGTLPSFSTKLLLRECEQSQAAASIQYISDWGHEALTTAPLIAEIDRAHILGCIATLEESFQALTKLIEPLGSIGAERHEAAFQQISKLALSAHGVGLAVSSSEPGRHHARSLHTFKMREAGLKKKADSPEEKIIQVELKNATKGWDGRKPSQSKLAEAVSDALMEQGIDLKPDAIFDRLRKYLP